MKKKMLSLFFLLLAAMISNGQVSLKFDFTTGGDNLRGGNDNANIIVLLKSGRLIRFDNVNARGEWKNHTTHTIRKYLPSGVHASDIKGARIETTFTGGFGGDNWNLDKLVINATEGRTNTRLMSQSGNPLFRFTGDHRVKEFFFSSGPTRSAPPVMTGFHPRIHGFKFVNSFTNNFISGLDIRTKGLCGGMVYSALDYFNYHKRIPQQGYMPAEGTQLQSYLYNRNVDAIKSNLDKWAEVGLNPGGARNREFFNWGIQTGSGRLGELMRKIDANIPVTLGLQSCGDDCNCGGGKCPGNHQVLAIGYQLGRYNGDLRNHIEDLSIFIYNPNNPDTTMTLKADAAGACYYLQEQPNKKWRTYFVDYNYHPKNPPVIANNPSEIIVEFKTGTDDLRGGNDNVSVVLLLRSGRELRFSNVNAKHRWVVGSSQTINRTLPAVIHAGDIIGIKLITTFGGGIGGENWNLDRLTVKVKTGGTNTQLFSREGTPLFRFTGDHKEKEFRF